MNTWLDLWADILALVKWLRQHPEVSWLLAAAAAALAYWIWV
jgi:hypothetical protein